MWTESIGYPDKRIVSLSPRFEQYRLATAAVEQLYTGGRWAEGPVWFGDMRQLIWSDIPNNRMLRWDEATGSVSEFRKPSNNANGNTRDRVGRLLTCEHLTRRVTRTEYDGSVSVIAEGFDGHRLNSPNDVVVSSDGAVWFSDPPFGIAGFYEGQKQQSEIPARVYRVDPETHKITIVIDDLVGPNGLAFSPQERLLYVVESRGQRGIFAYDVKDEGTLSNGRRFVDAVDGTPDGIRIDINGNLWCGWGMGKPELDGVRVFSPDGEAIGHIMLPERCANLTFGGEHGNRLFMAASKSLYSLYVNTQGVAWSR